MRELQIIKITPGDILLHSILAVSHVTSQKKSAVDGTTSTSTTAASATETSVVVGGEEQVLKSNILGFVYVVSVDDTKGLINVMSPNPKKLGRRVLLMGDLKWIDT